MTFSDEVLEEAAQVCVRLRTEKRKCSQNYNGHDDRWCAVCEDMADAYDIATEKIRALKSRRGNRK